MSNTTPRDRMPAMVPQSRVPSAQTRPPSAMTNNPAANPGVPAPGVVRAGSGRPGMAGQPGLQPRAGAPTPVTRATPAGGAPIQQRIPSGQSAGAIPNQRAPSGIPSSVPSATATTAAPNMRNVVPVTRNPSQTGLSTNRNRAGTGQSTNNTIAPAGHQAANPSPQQHPSGAQTAAMNTAQSRARLPTGSEGSLPVPAGARAAPTRESRAVMRSRRVSKVLLDKEQKTEYWREIMEEARHQAPELSQEDIKNMISRCLSLQLVANWKMRENQGDAPKASELFSQLSHTMEARLVELNGGHPVHVPGSGFTKIKNMEQQLQILEQKHERDQEEEAEKVKAKITELSSSLSALQKKKENEREQYRKTMTMEINNLREQMQKAAQDPGSDTARIAEENKKMAQKMIRLEAALRQMNEERRKGVEDGETAMLKKKLELFESKMKQLEEEKSLRKQEEHSDQLRDKLLLMEAKLAKMENRKSVSITAMMQEKMQQVEEQLAHLRQGGGGGDASKIVALEKKLVEMQNTKVNPSMINDPETRALRSHVKKMEEAMLAAEKKMEDDRKRVEEERNLALQKRQREEESYRKKAQERERLLLEKMAEMEKMINQRAGAPSGGGGGSNPGVDAAIQKKIAEMEQRMNAGGAFADKMAEMERRLKETEERLSKEKNTSAMLMSVLEGKGSGELAGIEKDMQISMLTQTTADLKARLEATAKQMEDQFSKITTKIETMKFTGGGPAAHVHKSGLSYEEINQKLEEIQKQLFDPDIDEKLSEKLNIDYEKLISELENTPEYKAEQEGIAKKWKEENTPLNNDALARVKAEIASWTPMKKTAQLKRKPELKFLDFTPDAIMKKHVNDFKGVTTQNLTLDEARALYANMPEFRKDMEAQVQFVEQLKQKIETDAKKPAVKAPPPIKASKPVVFKKPPPAKGGGGGNDFLGELLKKRKPVG